VTKYRIVEMTAIQFRPNWKWGVIKPEGPLHLWERAAELFRKYKERIDV
jgi:hypothetical protein